MTTDFAVAAAVISDFDGNIIKVATKRRLTNDASIGEAHAAMLAAQTAASCGVKFFVVLILEKMI